MKKKPINASIVIAILIGIIYFFILRTPLIVNRIKNQIKAGQLVEKVMSILNSSGKKPDLCCWQAQGTNEYICSNPKICDLPTDDVKFDGSGSKIRLTVLFMGPGFIHNDFHILFDSTGIVVSISEVERWD